MCAAGAGEGECMRGEARRGVAWRPRAVDLVRLKACWEERSQSHGEPPPPPPPPRGATLDKNNWDLGELM